MGTPCRMLAIVRRLPEPPADGGRLPVRVSRPPGAAASGGDPDDLGRHACLAGKVGELIVIARRHGDEWWVGAMGAENPARWRSRSVFSGPDDSGRRVYRDDLAAAARFARLTANVTNRDVIRTSLAPEGGFLMRVSFNNAPEAIAR